MTNSFKLMGLYFQLILISLALSLVGCAQFDVQESLKLKGQPGDYFVKQITEQKLTNQQQIVAMLQHTQYQSPKTKAYLTKDLQDTATLLKEISGTQDISQAIIQLSKVKPNKTEKWLGLAIKLFPIDAYRIVEQLSGESTIEQAIIESTALAAGLEPSRILPPTASSDLDHRIVPLIHSASLTVYNQYEGVETKLWYRPSTIDKWLPAYALQWEPIMGALSGSIVRLEPDTAYDVKLEFVDHDEVTDQRFYSFKTRPNSPPIDPDNIHYLSDIYSGGQLNLTSLGIQGTETGWALIIGDGVEIQASEDDYAAIDIGSQSYIKFENISVKGGKRHGIFAKQAHHIWINGCDISEYGQVGEDIRNGVAYVNTESKNPINYDSGIYLERTGVVTVEECEIHSPNGKANHWGYGHPQGPNAMLIWADHPTEEYRGQYIIRNNRFYGAPEHRFNDVIEGRSNFYRTGAFGRDSAIYNNYLAYANDDLIELDGGQSNVLFYDNELTQGYAGVSTAPNMIGPSYIFNNYIHDLGDERGKEWTAIKMGGLISRPGGITNLFNNLIVTNRNGIAASRVEGDDTFWVNAQNNIIITRQYNNMVGYGIYDKQKYEGSIFKNNLIYNTQYNAPFVLANIDDDFYHPWSEQPEMIDDIINTGQGFELHIEPRFVIPNFSSQVSPVSVPLPETADSLDFNSAQISPFDNQDSNANYYIEDNGSTLMLSGNSWKSVEYTYTININSVIQLDVKTNGKGEIVGLALENDNKLTNNRLFKFAGSQTWAQDQFKYTQPGNFQTITLPIGRFMAGTIDRLVFVLDDDKPSNVPAEAIFKNVLIFDQIVDYEQTLQQANNATNPVNLKFSSVAISSFHNQDKDRQYQITDNGNALTLQGNTWKSVDISYTMTPETLVSFDIKTNGKGEIAGIAFENDNILTNARLYKLAGSQAWINDLFVHTPNNEFQTIIIPIGRLLSGPINRLVFVMDDDRTGSTAEVTFKNVLLFERELPNTTKGRTATAIKIGIGSSK